MKKKVLILVMVATMMASVSGCSSFERGLKDWDSELSGGLNREVNIYSMTGEKIATHKGKIDIESTEYGNEVKFELNGKRYIYYNCMVEAIELEEEE